MEHVNHYQVHARVYWVNTQVPSVKHQFATQNARTAEHVYHPENVLVSKPSQMNIVKLRCAPTIPHAFLGIALTQSTVSVVMGSRLH